MSGAAFTVDARDTASSVIAALGGKLKDRRALNEWIAEDELELVRNYLTQIALTRHGSAQALGASPSKFWGRPDRYTTSHADGKGATVDITHPGIGRVAHDVTIRPTGGRKFLTIPLIAEAYNQRAYRVPDLVPFMRTGRGSGVLAKVDANGTITAWYALVKKVHQTQDRTLLPSDTAIRATAVQAAIEFCDAALNDRAAQQGGAA